MSLLLTPGFGSTELGSATGFVVEASGKPYLITNRHVVPGRRNTTDQTLNKQGATPNGLSIWHHEKGKPIGSWIRKGEALYDPNGKPLWLVHPKHGGAVDVVALPLTDLNPA